VPHGPSLHVGSSLFLSLACSTGRSARAHQTKALSSSAQRSLLFGCPTGRLCTWALRSSSRVPRTDPPVPTKPKPCHPDRSEGSQPLRLASLENASVPLLRPSISLPLYYLTLHHLHLTYTNNARTMAKPFAALPERAVYVPFLSSNQLYEFRLAADSQRS